MNRAVLTLAVLASYPLIAAGSCATTSEPRIETVTVKVPVVQPCPDKRDPEPNFVDSLDAIKDATARGSDALVALLLGGRGQRMERQDASDAQINACATPR